MDAETCLKKLQYVGVLAFATVDEKGNPQVRNISAIHYEPDAMYFFTARGKDFCKELLADGRVQVLGYTKYKEMIRLSAKATPVKEDEQKHWIDAIFSEQPYLSNVYPGETRNIGIVFEIRDAEIDYTYIYWRQSHFQKNFCDRQRKSRIKRVSDYRFLYQMRNLYKKLSPAVYFRRPAICDPAGSLPSLRELLRELPGTGSQKERII